MTTRKSKSEPHKARKLTLKKGTVKDLTTRRDAADALRGGAPFLPTYGPSCKKACSY
jgi:hypothetical protein